jgi:hypothetical protein
MPVWKQPFPFRREFFRVWTELNPARRLPFPARKELMEGRSRLFQRGIGLARGGMTSRQAERDSFRPGINCFHTGTNCVAALSRSGFGGDYAGSARAEDSENSVKRRHARLRGGAWGQTARSYDHVILQPG